MALCARRSRGCRAASWRRNPRGTSPGLLLTTSPSPGGLTVAASGVSKPGWSSAAARSERSSPGCGPGLVGRRDGAGRARSLRDQASVRLSHVPQREWPAGWGPAEAHPGGALAPDRVPASQRPGKGCVCVGGEMLPAAGRCRAHPQRSASWCWRLQAPPPGKGLSWWVRAG